MCKNTVYTIHLKICVEVLNHSDKEMQIEKNNNLDSIMNYLLNEK